MTFRTLGFAKDNGALKRIFGGWQISGIVTRQSGQPFTIVTGVDSNGNGGGGDRRTSNPADRSYTIQSPVTFERLRIWYGHSSFLLVPTACHWNFSLGMLGSEELL